MRSLVTDVHSKHSESKFQPNLAATIDDYGVLFHYVDDQPVRIRHAHRQHASFLSEIELSQPAPPRSLDLAQHFSQSCRPRRPLAKYARHGGLRAPDVECQRLALPEVTRMIPLPPAHGQNSIRRAHCMNSAFHDGLLLSLHASNEI